MNTDLSRFVLGFSALWLGAWTLFDATAAFGTVLIVFGLACLTALMFHE